MKEAIYRRPVTWAIVAFCATFVISLPFNKLIFHKYLVEPSRAFDANFYLNIAERGYQVPSETAFYPLWPLLISGLHKALPSELFVQTANLLSFMLFCISLGILWKVAERLTNSITANWTVFLFSLNPNSVFHAIAYPESLFSLLAVFFLWQTLNFLSAPGPKTSVMLFLTSAFMNASRPIVLQLLSAGFVAMGLTIFFLRKRSDLRDIMMNFGAWFGVVAAGSFAGYVPYGLHCYEKFGNFLQPFAAQSAWDRKFGFYWTLFTHPKSVSNSDNMLTWDIQGFYLPTILAIIFIAKTLRKKSLSTVQAGNTEDHIRTFVILFCLMIAAAHSAIAFLTYPIFMSLARHIFSTPIFFVGAVAVTYDLVPKPYRNKILAFYIFASIVYLVNFWTRFGNSSWMG